MHATKKKTGNNLCFILWHSNTNCPAGQCGATSVSSAIGWGFSHPLSTLCSALQQATNLGKPPDTCARSTLYMPAASDVTFARKSCTRGRATVTISTGGQSNFDLPGSLAPSFPRHLERILPQQY